MKDVRSFHNKVKEQLYQSNLKQGDTLLELAAGRAGDLHKWRKAKLSKVVAVELSASNIESPKQGGCVRYLKAKEDGRPIPDVLFVQADMTQPREPKAASGSRDGVALDGFQTSLAPTHL
jgi:hypothetical protein